MFGARQILVCIIYLIYNSFDNELLGIFNFTGSTHVQLVPKIYIKYDNIDILAASND